MIADRPGTRGHLVGLAAALVKGEHRGGIALAIVVPEPQARDIGGVRNRVAKRGTKGQKK